MMGISLKKMPGRKKIKQESLQCKDSTLSVGAKSSANLDQEVSQTYRRIKEAAESSTSDSRKQLTEARLEEEKMLQDSLLEIVDASIAGIYNSICAELSLNRCFMDLTVDCCAFVSREDVLKAVTKKTGLNIKPKGEQGAAVTLSKSAKNASVKVGHGKKAELDFKRLYQEVLERRTQWNEHLEQLAKYILDKLSYQVCHDPYRFLHFPECFEIVIKGEELVEQIFPSSGDAHERPKIPNELAKLDNAKGPAQEGECTLCDEQSTELLNKFDSLIYGARFAMRLDGDKSSLKLGVTLEKKKDPNRCPENIYFNLIGEWDKYQRPTEEFRRFCHLISNNLSCKSLALPTCWPAKQSSQECLLIYCCPENNKYLRKAITMFFGACLTGHTLWLKSYLEEQHPGIRITSAYSPMTLNGVDGGVVYYSSWPSMQRIIYDHEVPKSLPASYKNALMFTCEVIDAKASDLAMKASKALRVEKTITARDYAKVWALQLMKKTERLALNSAWSEGLMVYDEDEVGFALNSKTLDYLVAMNGSVVDLYYDIQLLMRVKKEFNSLSPHYKIKDGSRFVLYL